MTFRAFLSPPRTSSSSAEQSALNLQPCGRFLSRTLIALAAAAFLLPCAQQNLQAQNPPAYSYGYGQSGYPAQAYPPQAYPQQGYPQQRYPAQDQEAPPPPDYAEAAPNEPPPQNYPQQQEYRPGDSQQQPWPAQPYADQPQELAQQQQGLAPDQLDQLVAPIALYPDALLAQILAASTFPMQITEAERWREEQGDAPPQAIADGANAQPWDPSVKALTAFPQVLDNLARNLSWTTELGNAYYNQPQDVFDSVQSMRQRAQAAGNLESTPQETVTDDQGSIALAPPNPQIVYVPSYNPWTAYGSPVAPYPGFSLADTIGSLVNAGLQFGPGLVMSAFTAMPWGILGWGLSWLGHCLFYDNDGWYPHSETLADWGLPYGGPRYGWGHEDYGRGRDRGYGRGFGGGYGRGFDRGYNRGYNRGPERGLNPGFGRGYNRAGASGRSGFAGNGFAGARTGSGSRPGSRGYGGYGQQAYNRMPAFNARSGYGNGGAWRGSSSASYGRSPHRIGANSFGRGYSSSRQPQSSVRSAYLGGSGYGRNSFSGSSRGFSGFSSQRSGGFSGGARSSFSGGHFGGGHSFGGGGGHLSGGHFGGGHSFSGGGGHFGGGGHSFGGGHSSHFGGGGHGGGGHGGGGHGGHGGGGGHHR